MTGEICQFQHPAFKHYQIINRAPAEVAQEVANVGFVKVDGLNHIGDQAHIDAPSQHRMGKAFAVEMIHLQQD